MREVFDVSTGDTALHRFIHHEATGGMLLALAAVLAIVVVNLGFSDHYAALLA